MIDLASFNAYEISPLDCAKETSFKKFEQAKYIMDIIAYKFNFHKLNDGEAFRNMLIDLSNDFGNDEININLTFIGNLAYVEFFIYCDKRDGESA
ncbi:hypothetical protein LCGC14_1974270 [marine sediment metagenome]|uniref:Uncharacterized protein n=1 Tax=marine sediment metagenome TaxID=412755 RepID=A0A0F9HP71_9ZZZZ